MSIECGINSHDILEMTDPMNNLIYFISELSIIFVQSTYDILKRLIS